MKNITDVNVPVAHEKSPTAGPNLQLRWDYANLDLYRSVLDIIYSIFFVRC